MNEESLKKLAVGFMLADLFMLFFLFSQVVRTFLGGSYPETAFLIGVSLVLASQIVFFFERAFTPGEIWWIKDGFFIRRIGDGNRNKGTKKGQ